MPITYNVYIITNKKDGTLYIGRTENLAKRVYEYRNGFVTGFSKKYNLKNLVYSEPYENKEDAAKREMNMKFWQRK